MEIKTCVCFGCGVVGSFIAGCFGGWDSALITLCIFMVCDLLSGLAVAGIFHKSKKTETGTLSSASFVKGLFRKCMCLAFVLVAYRLDLMIGSDYIRDAVIIAFCASELLSLIENAGLMGVPMPAIIIKSVDILKQKAGEATLKIEQTNNGEEEKNNG